MVDTSKEIAYLILDKEIFKQKVMERIRIGQEFINRNVQTVDEQQKCWDEFIDWDNYNLEMIKQAFEYPDNVYASEYKRNTGAGGIVFLGSYKKPTFQESVKSSCQEMGYQVRSLKLLFDKIDLLRIWPSIDSGKPSTDSGISKLIHLLKKFHKISLELRERRSDREPIVIRDEYDVQYLINALLNLYFDDIRIEEFSSSNSGANTRLDFVLKDERIVLETKITGEKLRPKNLGEELLVDIGRYKSYPYCDDLVIFIYDKGDHIANKRGFIADLEKQSTPEMKITVIIIPE